MWKDFEFVYGVFFPAVAKFTYLTVTASASQLVETCYHIVTAFYNLAASPHCFEYNTSEARVALLCFSKALHFT